MLGTDQPTTTPLRLTSPATTLHTTAQLDGLGTTLRTSEHTAPPPLPPALMATSRHFHPSAHLQTRSI